MTREKHVDTFRSEMQNQGCPNPVGRPENVKSQENME